MSNTLDRRRFLKVSVATAAAAASVSKAQATVSSFNQPDSLYHGHDWESLNPGYWQITGHALRRRIHSYGDRARNTGFPFHYETHGARFGSFTMPVDYDPSLPPGFLWNRNWKLTGNYTLEIKGRIVARPHDPRDGDKSDWKMYQPGYGLVGLAFGSSTQYESYGQAGSNGKASWFAAWRDDGRFGIYEHGSEASISDERAMHPTAGKSFTLTVEVTGDDSFVADVTAELAIDGSPSVHRVEKNRVERPSSTDGYVGVVAQGLLDCEIASFAVEPGVNQPLSPNVNDCHTCYALGDTLKQVDGEWQVRFIGLFRSDGKTADVRISDSPTPSGGWANVAVAGSGPIVNNNFRRNTAVIDAKLPQNPADATLYYTVWKDGVDVTSDSRLGSDAVGIGTGQLGTVPGDGNYVGRLPRLQAPYKLCGLSCHAINGGGPNLPDAGRGGGFFVHDQPTPDAYKHLDEYDFQVMMWEDDVWYMELLLYPPSPDDAYKIVTTTICGPTSRWQMMRHWNTINPGDHDYGMDDIKGPEQIAIRNHADLGQDVNYMRRNFQIVHHLVTGDESPSGTTNPKKWRRWKMPNRDFSLLIIDSRLWRSSQDTNIWDDEGWGNKENLYSRTDVTRSLLGEEQFAWLSDTIRTDSSPLICLTGINGMHTIWTGDGSKPGAKARLYERDRVAADYAGWVSAGVDRILEVLGSRDGVVSVYGDVHVGMILRNTAHRLYECSFGPIGRSGGRGVKEGFGPKMQDFDGRDLEIKALYHQSYDSPMLEKKEGPFYWNFLEMEFDPRGADPQFGLRVRNLVDAPTQQPRGGGSVSETAAHTGRVPTCGLPRVKLLSDADVLVTDSDGHPIRAGRTLADGSLPIRGLVGVDPGRVVIMTARKGDQVSAKAVTTIPAEA